MPELPDVEIFRRHLAHSSLKTRIDRVAVSEPRVLEGVSARTLASRLRGRRLMTTRRHGKHLLVALDRGGWLTLHFGMTGDLQSFKDMADEPAHDRVRFDFADDHHLAYVNVRLLGRVGLTDDADEFVRKEELGPDALDHGFDLKAFKKALEGRRSAVKAALMDQSVLAGVGNIYADEILFQARLHPKTPVDRLDPKALGRLFRALKRVLETAVNRGAGSERFLERLPSTYLLRRREDGAPCPRCKGRIKAIKVSGRTSYLCPRCQPAKGT